MYVFNMFFDSFLVKITHNIVKFFLSDKNKNRK